jgi:hypothetical protein
MLLSSLVGLPTQPPLRKVNPQLPAIESDLSAAYSDRFRKQNLVINRRIIRLPVNWLRTKAVWQA